MGRPLTRAFDRELADLDRQVRCTAAMVAEAMAAAREALVTGDRAAATAAADRHAQVQHTGRGFEAYAYQLLARRQPTAGDLRLVLTAVRLSYELERTSKLVKHVAAFALRPRGPLPHPLSTLVARMASEANDMIRGAVDAYATRDPEAAEALDVWDDRMDDLHRQLLAELFASGLGLGTTLEVALVGRYLERIGDHAVVIGERVRYLVTGEL